MVIDLRVLVMWFLESVREEDFRGEVFSEDGRMGEVEYHEKENVIADDGEKAWKDAKEDNIALWRQLKDHLELAREGEGRRERWASLMKKLMFVGDRHRVGDAAEDGDHVVVHGIKVSSMNDNECSGPPFS